MIFGGYLLPLFYKSKKEGKDQESIQSSTTPDQGYQWESVNVTIRHHRERSGSVVECLTRDRGAAGSILTGVTALWSLSKTHLS